MEMWAITAQVLTEVKTDMGMFSGSKQIPIFYLNPRVHGIFEESHAVKIAGDIINPLGSLKVSITAVKVTL